MNPSLTTDQVIICGHRPLHLERSVDEFITPGALLRWCGGVEGAGGQVSLRSVVEAVVRIVWLEVRGGRVQDPSAQIRL